MRWLITVLTLLPLTGASAAVAADSLQAHGQAGMMVLTQNRTTARVHRSGGGEESVTLPPGAEVNTFRALASGWLAAATAPAGEGTRLFLLSGSSSGTQELTAPAAGQSVREPVLLGFGDSVAGLAWIETNRVYAAARAGGAWTVPSVVAAANAGTTLGLAGSALADGRWLLLWSASDGEDDEIYWSLRTQQGEWSTPERLAPDNAVPDLTPAVYATTDGALAAWSRFDGREYELVLSQLAGTIWSAPRRIAGAGALRPSFSEPEATGAPLLLYRAARPRGWVVVETQAPFREVARSTLDRPDRPAVGVSGASVQLIWSGSGKD